MSFVIEKATINRRGLKLHNHNTYEIIVFKSGCALFNYDGKSVEVKGGNVIIIPPNLLHCTSTCNGEFEYYYLLGLEVQRFNLLNPVILNYEENNEAVILADLIYLNHYSTNQNYLNSLINSLTLFLSNVVESVDDVTASINSIILEISRDFTNPDFNVTKLLNKSGYAEDYARAKFKKITGKTPNEFLTEMRINHAKKLISAFDNSASLFYIANLCGFIDYPYFSRKFKKITGVSPKKYLSSGDNL